MQPVADSKGNEESLKQTYNILWVVREALWDIFKTLLCGKVGRLPDVFALRLRLLWGWTASKVKGVSACGRQEEGRLKAILDKDRHCLAIGIDDPT